jgi:hypothetical protein
MAVAVLFSITLCARVVHCMFFHVYLFSIVEESYQYTYEMTYRDWASCISYANVDDRVRLRQQTALLPSTAHAAHDLRILSKGIAKYFV